VSSTSSGSRYELEALVTFTVQRTGFTILEEITAMVKRLPGGLTSGGSTPLNRHLSISSPITQTYTQQFDMQPSDVSAVWIVTAAGHSGGQEFRAGPEQVALAFAAAPTARVELQLLMPPGRGSRPL
jgi:hypothetical protein